MKWKSLQVENKVRMYIYMYIHLRMHAHTYAGMHACIVCVHA